jgi:hypothetical protein
MVLVRLCICVMHMIVIGCMLMVIDMKMIIIEIVMDMWVIIVNCLKMVMMKCWGWIRMGMTVTSITCFLFDNDGRWGDAFLL